MSISRTITIRLLTNESKFSDLFSTFILNFWNEGMNFCIASLEKDDIDNFNYIDFHDFKYLKPILDFRENNGNSNYLSFMVNQLNETISICSEKLKNNYKNDKSHFELTFTPGIGKRIENAERYTDFGFYLNQIIPRLIEINCHICEIECRDYDF